MAAGCSPVVTVGGEAAAMRRLGLDNVGDEFPGEGPLGGVLTALSVGAPAVVVACDMPRLGVATVTSLIAGLDQHDAAMACSDRKEPLCAIWSQRAVAPLRAQFVAGERAMHRAIAGLDIAWIVVSTTDLGNVNTPGDLGNL
jgi:molybdopterin-guanine dinucleotide biosynthesis protein A